MDSWANCNIPWFIQGILVIFIGYPFAISLSWIIVITLILWMEAAKQRLWKLLVNLQVKETGSTSKRYFFGRSFLLPKKPSENTANDPHLALAYNLPASVLYQFFIHFYTRCSVHVNPLLSRSYTSFGSDFSSRPWQQAQFILQELTIGFLYQSLKYFHWNCINKK